MVLTRSRVAKNGHADRGAAVDLIDSNWDDEEEESACDNVAALSAKATEEAVVKEDAMLSEDAIAADREKSHGSKNLAGREVEQTTQKQRLNRSSKLMNSRKKTKKKKIKIKIRCVLKARNKARLWQEKSENTAPGESERRERTRGRERERRDRRGEHAQSSRICMHPRRAGRKRITVFIQRHPTTSTDYGSMVVSSFRLRG
jgi:hypothetical protein